MTYSISLTGSIIRDADHASIPTDQANPDYLAYLAWVAEGNTATAYAAPAPTWQSYQVQAQSALDDSDTTMHRIGEAVALGLNAWTNADVVAWVNYRRALRAIVSASAGTPGTLPTRPAYPAGT